MSVDRIFITGPLAWRWLGKYVTLDRTFYRLIFKQEVVAAPVTSNLFFFMAFFAEVFIWNVINIIWIHFTNINIVCINYNNVIINNSYDRLQESVLLFRISFGIWKDFFEICWQSGQAPSTMLASPALQQTSHRSVMLGSYASLPSSGVEEVLVVLDAAVVWICNPVI